MSSGRSSGPGRLVATTALLAAGAVAYRWAIALPRAGSPFLAGAPLLIAHRGGAALAPENTLEAFRRALEWWGADVLELDVRTTRDGEVVVIHDATLDRTTSASGPVAEHTLAEIQTADAGHRFTTDDGSSFPFRGRGVRVPTLAEVLREFPATRVNVEIKDARAQRRVREVVREAGAEHRVLIAAEDRAHRALFDGYPGAVSASRQELKVFYALHRAHATALYRPTADAFQMPERHQGRQVLSPRWVRDAHACNVAVHVWTVDEEADMERLLDWGVDGIVTDRPDRLARVLHRRVGRPLPPGPPAGEVA